MNGTVGRWEKHTEKRTGSDSTAWALPCIPYPWPSECQKALRGIRNKQSFCFVKIQREERSGWAELKPDSAALLQHLISCHAPETRHILQLTSAETPKHILEWLGDGENPGKCLTLFRMVFRESQEGRRDQKVKVIYFKWSGWFLNAWYAMHSLYLSHEHRDWHSGTNQSNSINYLMLQKKWYDAIFSLPTPCHRPMHWSIKITNFFFF